MNTQIKKVRPFKAGYELRTEIVTDDGSHPMEWTMAYAPDGGFIGDPKEARRLAKRGIIAERATPEKNVCSVGYSTKDGKWYGWSHRAICGFKIGDMIFEEKCPGATGKTPFKKHGRKPIKTLADARLAAVRFAGYVS